MYECMNISGVLIHVRMPENFRCFNSCMNAWKLIFDSCMNACKLIFDSCMNAWKIDLMKKKIISIFLFLFFCLFFYTCMFEWNAILENA